MIVASIGLVLVAAGLVVAGMVRADETLYYASIIMSALSGTALIAGARRLRTIGPPRPGTAVSGSAPLGSPRPRSAMPGPDTPAADPAHRPSGD